MSASRRPSAALQHQHYHHPSSPEPPLPLPPRTSSRTLRDTYTRTARDDSSTPSTPRASDRRPRKGKEPAHSTPTRRDRAAGDSSAKTSKHTHGDSWSSTTRDSVVDNLLMSLDELSMQMKGTFDGVRLDSMDQEREKEADRIRQAPLHAAMNRPSPRARGHTYSSSMSSDFDRNAMYDPPTSKYGSPSHKGRRSNSSSTFNTFTPKQNRTVAPTSKYNGHGRGRTSSDLDRRAGLSSPTKSGSSHRRDESDNSLGDVGYDALLESTRLAFNGRSISMDHMYDQANAGTSASMMNRGRPVPSMHSKYESGTADAAPEPTVAAGPRKQENPSATGPVYVNAAQKQSSLRKTTTQSDLRAANNTVPQGIRDQATAFVRNTGGRGENITYVVGKGSNSNSTRRKDANATQQDRPGFFKRVFGSSSNRSSAAESPTGSDVSLPGRKQSAPQKDAAQQPSEASINVSNPPATLNKKPSSFFRRRKRSISESAPPPPSIPLNAASMSPEPHHQPSVSSFREVMDSYLNKMDNPVRPREQDAQPERSLSRDSRKDTRNEDLDDLELFHCGYTPPVDPSLGTRNPLSRHGTLRLEPEAESPQTKMKVKKRRPDAPLTMDVPESAAKAQLRDTDSNSSAQVSPMTIVHPENLIPNKPSAFSGTQSGPYDGDRRPVSPVSRASTGDRIIASGVCANVEPNQETRGRPAGDNRSPDMHNESQLTTHDTLHAYDRPGNKTVERPHLQQRDAEDKEENKTRDVPADFDSQQPLSSSASMKLPFFTAVRADSAPSALQKSPSSLPIVQVEGNDAPRPSVDTIGLREQPAPIDTDNAKDRARRIFEGNEENVTRMEAAAWLGELKSLNQRTLDVYMQLFDFSGMNILSTLRALCGKLVLKGETQQFDRIITALSARWCQCNPNHGFKAQDVVHTILYSIILLNTDLHMAEIGEKMSKNAYVKNTLPTIRRVVADAAPNAFEEATVRAASNTQSRPSIPWMDSSNSVPSTTVENNGSEPNAERTSSDVQRPAISKRISMRPGMFRTESDGFVPDSANSSSSQTLVSAPWAGTMRTWEFEIETALKSFYSSIKNEPLPLLDLAVSDVRPNDRNLSVASLRRTGSVISKAPSEAASYRSKAGLRGLALGWQGRNGRPRPKVYASSTIGSSRTSFDDNSSLHSPAQSSTWDKNSYARTLTSTSVGSLGYHLTPTDTAYKHSIGFANALSQAIIREEGGGNGDTDSVTLKQDLLEDESLTLEGAPWAKEGLVKHKHHLEGPERKSRDRNWSECFAVISKGKLTLFNFNTGATKSYSLGRARLQKNAGSRAASIASARVGGGDWTENAEQLDSFTLRQTIASVLPPPGYSKARPHVWALSLPSGGVHLFQVGTPEIANEWMSTANYWSARLSKEPLSGGVSNIEYGWSDAAINPALLERTSSITSNNTVSVPPPSIRNRQRGHTHTSSGGGGRPSIQSSVRSSFDGIGGGSRNRMPGDKIQITDWQPPSQSMMASQLMEVDQLKSLQTYVANVEAELETHNELKHAIELAYSPRASNYFKTMSNWQRKSEYLLREIVKFRTYIESLTAAATAKEEVLARRAERDAELAVLRSNAAAASAAAASAEVEKVHAGGEEVEEIKRPEDDDSDDGNDEFEEAVESRDITPRQSSVPGSPVPAA